MSRFIIQSNFCLILNVESSVCSVLSYQREQTQSILNPGEQNTYFFLSGGRARQTSHAVIMNGRRGGSLILNRALDYIDFQLFLKGVKIVINYCF